MNMSRLSQYLPSSRVATRCRLLLCALLLLSSSPLLPTTGIRGGGGGIAVSAYLYLVHDQPLVCLAGYGQRGKLRSAGVEWVRTCKHSHYCWEATAQSSDEGAIEDMKKLFDFPWDAYYAEYYIQGCSGDFGTNQRWSPLKYTSDGVELQELPLEVDVNITVPPSITGRGGTIQMSMQYSCIENFCSSAQPSSHRRRSSSSLNLSLLQQLLPCSAPLASALATACFLLLCS